MKKRALITGASRGIGAAIARSLAHTGIQTVCPSRDELDLSKMDSIFNYIETHKNDDISILINNAGINILNPLEKIDISTWEMMLQINLSAPFLLIQGFAENMKKQKWGRIVNVSSVFSIITKENRIAYTTTKSGLNGLTRAASVELAPYDILVNAVCPGYVGTEMTFKNNSPQNLQNIIDKIPSGKMINPDEIASYVTFLCSEKNTCMTGQTLIMDGGLTNT